MLGQYAEAWRAGVHGLSVGDFGAAAHSAERAHELARETGLPGVLMEAQWLVGDVVLARESRSDPQTLARVRVLLEEAAQIAQRLLTRGQIPEVSARAARICVRLQDFPSARRHIADADRAILDGDLSAACVIAIAKVELASADGDLETAEHTFAQAAALLEGSGWDWDLTLLRIAIGQVLMDWGRAEDAGPLLALAREFFSDPLAEGWRRRIDAVLAGSVSAT